MNETANKKTAIARIVPAIHQDGGINATAGTKVMVGDQELYGVTRISIYGEPNDVWRACIECYVQPEAITVLAEIEESPRPEC